MEPQRTHDVVQVEQPVAQQVPVNQVGEPMVVQAAPSAYVADTVVTTSRFALHTVLAAVMAIGMIVWGGIIMARAGFDGPLQDPEVSAVGLTGNALSGLIVAGLGLILLFAALSADRSAITFFAIVIGIAALVATIEPNLGDGALAIERPLPLIIAIAAGVVVAAALLVPTMNRSTRTVARV